VSTIQAASRRPALVSDSLAFWGLAGVLALFMGAASAPSPLYQVYAAEWHFSSLTLTVVFALYAIALLVALLVTGRLSDHLGRRPVIIAALLAEMAAMACFIAAGSTVVLGLARVLQGAATGAAIGALSAALTELSPGPAPVVNSASPTFGLAAGALGASALVQYGPAPTRLVYWLLLAGFAAGALLAAVTRETGERRPGALGSLVPSASVSPRARPMFFRVLPCLVALWALSGFYLSLGPGLAASITGSRNLLWGGLVIFLLCACGGLAVVLARAAAARWAMLWGCAALFAGVGLTFAAIATSTFALFAVGSLIAGAGFGLSFLGAFRTLAGLAAPSERAGTIAVIYIASYLAFSVPIVAAGVATTSFSTHDVALVFSAAVAVLASIGTSAGLPARSPAAGDTSPPRATADLPPCPGTVPPHAGHASDAR
jgi:predicted MFS family arabinose efflux permease